MCNTKDILTSCKNDEKEAEEELKRPFSDIIIFDFQQKLETMPYLKIFKIKDLS